MVSKVLVKSLLLFYYPKSIKFSSWIAAPPCPCFDHSAISSLTSLPNSSCSLVNSSLVPKLTSCHSILTDATFAVLLDQSLGDRLWAGLGETVTGWGLKLLPAPSATTGCEWRVDIRALGRDPGCFADVLRIDASNALACSVERALNVSEEGEKQEEGNVIKAWLALPQRLCQHTVTVQLRPTTHAIEK